MSYTHIDNLYRNQAILMFREAWVMEKVHGTSTHVSWNDGKLGFFGGGCKHEQFVGVFDQVALTEAFIKLGEPKIIVFGEGYGGKMQGMRDTYGPDLGFVAFDVKIGDIWLSVPQAHDVVTKLGLEFVPYVKSSTDLSELDKLRDAPSEIAVRRGIAEPKAREGIVIRPLIEVTLNNGSRIVAKHKGDAFRETKTPRKVVDPSKVEVLRDAEAVADEYVVPMRCQHVLDKMPKPYDISQTGEFIKAMLEDIRTEAKGEIVDSKEARVAIGKKAAKMFKQMFVDEMRLNEAKKLAVPPTAEDEKWAKEALSKRLGTLDKLSEDGQDLGIGY